MGLKKKPLLMCKRKITNVRSRNCEINVEVAATKKSYSLHLPMDTYRFKKLNSK